MLPKVEYQIKGGRVMCREKKNLVLGITQPHREDGLRMELV